MTGLLRTMNMMRLLLIGSVLLTTSSFVCSQQDADPWSSAPDLLGRIKEPAIPDRTFLITDFGARGDGKTDCTVAIRTALEICAQSGGGNVVVPHGVFLTGPIHLKSNTNLALADSSVLRFDTNPDSYLPVVLTRWEGVECYNYSPLIYAEGEENIAISGKGVLDGQADRTNWWPWKGKAENGWAEGDPNQDRAREKLFAMGEAGVPVTERKFGEGSYLRPSFIQFYRCRNIGIGGVKIVRSPMWEINPVLCTNVTIKNVDIDSHGPNNDGIDPECSRDVLIENCTFNTGDDCIAIKSGRNNDGRRVNVPSENIVIRHCRFLDGHGGVTIGSEISGSARNIFVEDCSFDSPILYNALRLKSNAVRGGTIENIFMRRLMVSNVGRAVFDVDLMYEEGEHGPFLPTIRNIQIDSMTVGQCTRTVNLVGYEKSPLRHILIRNSEFRNVRKDATIKYVEELKFLNCTMNGKLIQSE